MKNLMTYFSSAVFDIALPCARYNTEVAISIVGSKRACKRDQQHRGD